MAGGLGGIGRSIIKWMVTRGAKYLLVPSRSGAASAAAAEVVRELSDQNVVVSTPKCDVSSKDLLSRILEESATTLPPIRGCIIATMVLNVSNKTNRGRNLTTNVPLGWHIREHDPATMGADFAL